MCMCVCEYQASLGRAHVFVCVIWHVAAALCKSATGLDFVAAVDGDVSVVIFSRAMQKLLDFAVPHTNTHRGKQPLLPSALQLPLLCYPLSQNYICLCVSA